MRREGRPPSLANEREVSPAKRTPTMSKAGTSQRLGNHFRGRIGLDYSHVPAARGIEGRDLTPHGNMVAMATTEKTFYLSDNLDILGYYFPLLPPLLPPHPRRQGRILGLMPPACLSAIAPDPCSDQKQHSRSGCKDRSWLIWTREL